MAGIYVELVPTPGIYKNGKYLGTVPAAFIKVGDGITLGKKRGTATIGYLRILRNGGLVAKLNLTAEGFMELRPEKISEVFPQIKGEVERFKGLLKVGDYTLQYRFFQPVSYSYYRNDNFDEGRRYNPAYSSSAGNVWNDDDDRISHDYKPHDYITDPAWSSLPGNIYHDDSNNWVFDPAYSSLEGNIYHDTFHDTFHNSFHDSFHDTFHDSFHNSFHD